MTNELPNNGGDPLKLNIELQQFAAELSRLRPRDDRLDREQLAFLAGRASVIREPSGPLKVLGLLLRSHAWPTAFAGMTALAASLLVALLMRPEATKSPPPFVRLAAGEATPPAIAFADNPTMLTARDVRWGNVESRLAQPAADQVGMQEPSLSNDDRDVQVLTPISWQQVIGEGKPAVPFSPGASNDSQYRGANS